MNETIEQDIRNLVIVAESRGKAIAAAKLAKEKGMKPVEDWANDLVAQGNVLVTELTDRIITNVLKG